MKKITKIKYFILWLVVWISLLSIWVYASVTWDWTIWKLFERLWTSGHYYYRLIWDNIKDNTVDSSEIENNTLTANDLAANSVWSSELANNAVDTNAIQNWVVTENKIAQNTLDDSEIQDNSLTASSLAANSVWSSELANNAVDTNAIQNWAVTENKIAQNTLDDSEIQDNSLTASSLAANSVWNSELQNEIEIKKIYNWYKGSTLKNENYNVVIDDTLYVKKNLYVDWSIISNTIVMSWIWCSACPNWYETFLIYRRSRNMKAQRCKNLLNWRSKVNWYNNTPVCAVRWDYWDNKKLNSWMSPRNIGSNEIVNIYWYAKD